MTISVPGPNGKNDPLAEIRWQSRREFGQSRNDPVQWRILIVLEHHAQKTLTAHAAVIVLRSQALEERYRFRERLNPLHRPVRHVGRRLGGSGGFGWVRAPRDPGG